MENEDIKHRLVTAALDHVPFDGWSEQTFAAAIRDTGVDDSLARALLPRGAVDLAVHYHQMGDQEMLARLREADLSDMRFRDKVATAVRFRLEQIGDKEAVRRATTLFALPQYAPDGAKAIWATADLIWTELGDTSDDINWYTKRATLSGVISSTVLFWLGDHSPGDAATWDFLDRRIDNVMQIEKIKAQVNRNPLLKPFMAGPNWLAQKIRAPKANGPVNPPAPEGTGL